MVNSAVAANNADHGRTQSSCCSVGRKRRVWLEITKVTDMKSPMLHCRLLANLNHTLDKSGGNSSVREIVRLFQPTDTQAMRLSQANV
jgi:hypothetical protein